MSESEDEEQEDRGRRFWLFESAKLARLRPRSHLSFEVAC